MNVTDMCVDGALIRYVGVSLSKSPTQAYKGNVNVLLIRISADQEMDASEGCDGCVRRRGTYHCGNPLTVTIVMVAYANNIRYSNKFHIIGQFA